jgi:hypothetical protein
MSTEYPDVLSDLVEARERYEVNGVHYLMELLPPTIAPGQTTLLRVWLQSCWDVPVEVRIRIQLPIQPSPTFTVIQKQTDVPLEEGEVGEVTIPIVCMAETVPGDFDLTVALRVKLESPGQYVRSKEHAGRLGKTSLRFTTGMSLAATVGIGYVASTQPESIVTLHVQGTPQPTPTSEMIPTYLSHWTVDELTLLGRARRHVNDRRLYLLPKVTRNALYLSFLTESQVRLKDAALPLQIGESVFLAKILTYAVEYFMQRPDGQDVILVPAYMLAFRHDLQPDDPVLLIVRADYARIARLAASLSFGMLHQQLGRDVWTIEEQLAVTDLVADRVERGGSLSAEFLYLPLLLGGLMIASEVQMPGENPIQSLDLFAKAREKRTAELEHNQELSTLLDRMEQQARSS